MRNLRLAVALMLLTTGCSLGTEPQDMFHIHGIVIDRATSQPAPGVTIRAFYSGGCSFFGGGCYGDETIKTAVTDAKGSYAIDFDPGRGVCIPFYVSAADFASNEGYYGSTNDCEDKGRQILLNIYITR